MKGTFRQRPEQPHITLRRQLLDGSSSLSNPAPPRKASAADVEGVGALAQEQLTEHGVVAISLDRPMTNREYLAFGALLGTAQLEHSPAVQPFVEEGVILNLVTCEPATSNPDLQPFAANWLALHSESSSLPIAAQPRFVSLMCLAADGDSAAETVLVPMRQVFDALTDEDRKLLANTRYDGRDEAPPLLRYDRGRPVFSIRDFQDENLEWECLCGAAEPAEVDEALIRLYAAMYGGRCYHISWQCGLLVVIDNTVHFHGRTIACAPPKNGPLRHLKRLRLSAAAS